jgi:lipoate-protein ligase A
VKSAARFVDVGLLEPARFHATYTGLALALDEHAAPVVVWGRARAHVSLGQGQDARAQLAPDIGVPVVRRPLGGGAVWVDESQYCYVLVVPLARAPRRPADWFEWGLRPAISTYRRFGLDVSLVDQDLWLDGRKIAGSGAATLGACAVLASSFLMRFPASRFARCLRAPSADYRDWLVAGLAQSMTDWESHGRPPGRAVLGRAFRAAVHEEMGWRLRRSALDARECVAPEGVLAELHDSGWQTRALPVARGIKLNARSFLAETHGPGGTLRMLKIAGSVVRAELVPRR